MENFIYFLLGGVLGFVIDLFFPKLREALYSLLTQIQQWFSASPINLTDTWYADFIEKDHEGKQLNSRETIKIKHYGTFFEATGEIGAPHPRSFKYSGKQFHDLVWGTYEKDKTNSGSLEGIGVFILKINPERTEMNGYCTYHDKDTGKLEHSTYSWRRI